MSRKLSRHKLEPSPMSRCPYTSRKLPRGSCPLPSLLASVGGLQPVYTITMRSMMGGCEIVDYANRASAAKAEERLVVDLAMIGHDRDYSNEGPNIGNSMFQQQQMIVNSNQLTSSDASSVIKRDELSLMDTQKIINDNNVNNGRDGNNNNNNNNSSSNNSSSNNGRSNNGNNNNGSNNNNNGGNNNNYEYANLIEGMMNNVMESNATAIKNVEKESNNNNNENGFEYFNYDSSQIVELATADSSAPVIISLQNFYDPLGSSQTSTQMAGLQQLGNLSTGSSAESSPSPTSTVIDLDNEHSRYCSPDSYKLYREGLDGSTFPAVQSDGFVDGFFEFDDLGQRFASHPRITESVAEESAAQLASFAPAAKRKKREQRILSSWEREKRICCSQCSKKFRTAAHLKTHFVVHTMGESMKLSRCTVCGKGFCHRGALTLHMRAHVSKESAQLRGGAC